MASGTGRNLPKQPSLDRRSWKRLSAEFGFRQHRERLGQDEAIPSDKVEVEGPEILGIILRAPYIIDHHVDK